MMVDQSKTSKRKFIPGTKSRDEDPVTPSDGEHSTGKDRGDKNARGKTSYPTCPACQNPLTAAVLRCLCKDHKESMDQVVTEQDRMIRFYWLMDTRHEILRWARSTVAVIGVVVIISLSSIYMSSRQTVSNSDKLLNSANDQVKEAAKKNDEAQRMLATAQVALTEFLGFQDSDDYKKFELFKTELEQVQLAMAEIKSRALIDQWDDVSSKSILAGISGQITTGLEDQLRRDIASVQASVRSIEARHADDLPVALPAPSPVRPASLDWRPPVTIFDSQATLEWAALEDADDADYAIDIWITDPNRRPNPPVTGASAGSTRPTLADPLLTVPVTGTRYELKMEQLDGFKSGRIWWRIRDISSNSNAPLASSVVYFDLYANSLDRILRTRELRVGVFPSTNGLFIQQADSSTGAGPIGSLEGLEIELMRWISASLESTLQPSAEQQARLGSSHGEIECRFIRRDWNSLFTSLQTGEVDCIISSITATKAREEQFSISFSEPYYQTNQCAIVRNDEIPATAEDIAGKPIALVAGTTSERFAKLYRPSAIVKIARVDDILLAIDRGDVYAGFTDYAYAWNGRLRLKANNELRSDLELLSLPYVNIQSQNQDYSDVENYGIAVLEQDTQLLKMINELLQCDEGQSKLIELALKASLPFKDPQGLMPEWSTTADSWPLTTDFPTGSSTADTRASRIASKP